MFKKKIKILLNKIPMRTSIFTFDLQCDSINNKKKKIDMRNEHVPIYADNLPVSNDNNIIMFTIFLIERIVKFHVYSRIIFTFTVYRV